MCFIPNTAVFGPTNFIGTIASTARMKISDEDFNSIQFNSDICTRQLINYHGGARDEHRKHDPQVGDFKKKSEFSI